MQSAGESSTLNADPLSNLPLHHCRGLVTSQLNMCKVDWGFYSLRQEDIAELSRNSLRIIYDVTESLVDVVGVEVEPVDLPSHSPALYPGCDVELVAEQRDDNGGDTMEGRLLEPVIAAVEQEDASLGVTCHQKVPNLTGEFHLLFILLTR